MSIRRATIIPDTLVPAGDGLSGAQFAAVRIDGTAARAYVKPLPPEGCAAEAFCALLLRAWGLSVPEPLWIEEKGAIWFGCLDAEYPSLKQRFHLHLNLPEPARKQLEKMAAALAVSLSSAGLACAADEAIANGDRNFGNILWDGGEAEWIDHERSLGLAPGDANKLAAMAILSEQHENLQRSAISAALTLVRNVVDDIPRELPVDVSHFAALVSRRLVRLGNLVDARFPKPPDDLFS